MSPITFYASETPNNLKIAIALLEMELDYSLIHVDLDAGQQFAPDFLAISPNNKVPVIVDQDGPDGHPISIFESGAILQYLAHKTGKFYSNDLRRRTEVDQWLFWQIAGLGPMLGQAWHFTHHQATDAYSASRFRSESRRLGGVLEMRLQRSKYLGGETYSIADIAAYPWVRSSWHLLEIARATHPNCFRWLASLRARPAVRAANAVLRGLPSLTERDHVM